MGIFLTTFAKAVNFLYRKAILNSSSSMYSETCESSISAEQPKEVRVFLFYENVVVGPTPTVNILVVGMTSVSGLP